MKLFRALAGFAVVLGTAGWLMADTIPDPIIKLSIPGGHSEDICDPGTSDHCHQFLTDPIDGFGSFDLHNPVSNRQIIEQKFFIPTPNLDQPFTASTTDFLQVVLTPWFEGVTVDDVHLAGNQLEVDFLGIGPGDGGQTFLPGGFCDFDFCPTGFGPGHIFVESFFATSAGPLFDPNNDPPPSDGVLRDEHESLSLAPDSSVPEPGSFVLLLGAGGLLALKRKFYRR